MMKKQHGFTVIEITIVFVIVGILAVMALPGFQQFLIKRDIKQAKTQLSQSLQLARQMAISENTLVAVSVNHGTLVIKGENGPNNQTVHFPPKVNFITSLGEDSFSFLFRPVGTVAYLQNGNVIDADSDLVISIKAGDNDANTATVKLGSYGSLATQ